MAARMVTVRTPDICSGDTISLRRRLSFCKEGDAADVPAADEDDEILMDPEEVRPTHVEVPRIDESASQICEENILERCTGAMVDTKNIALLDSANQEAANGESIPVYNAMEKVERRTAT